MKTVELRVEPTVRQADAILAGLEDTLRARGIRPTRRGLELRFRVPMPPWRVARVGLLAAVTSGTVKVMAGAGDPWRVRYQLDYTILRGLCVLLSIAAVVMGLGWPRLTLVNTLAAIWLLAYLAPRWLAARRFDALVRDSATEVLERRRTPRDVPAQ